MLFSRIREVPNVVCLPRAVADFARLSPSVDFTTQYLKADVLRSLLGQLTSKGFKVISRDERTDVHLREADHQLDSGHEGYVISLAEPQFDISIDAPLPNVSSIRTAKTRLLNADICIVEHALALRGAVGCGEDCTHSHERFKQALLPPRPDVGGISLELRSEDCSRSVQYSISMVRYLVSVSVNSFLLVYCMLQ